MTSPEQIMRLPAPGSSVFNFNSEGFEAHVVDRPNRFVVNVRRGTDIIKCHLHDPGRLKELIFPGNRVLCRSTKGEKTQFSVTAALEGDEWVLTDTRIHNSIAAQFLPEGSRPEVKIGNHRIDFVSGTTLIEVKGCTLMLGGVATFPDAPTVRGRDHIKLLRDHMRKGGDAVLVVLVFRKDAVCFTPNRKTDPAFHQEFFNALREGLKVFIPRFSFEDNHLRYQGTIDVCEE